MFKNRINKSLINRLYLINTKVEPNIKFFNSSANIMYDKLNERYSL